MQLKTLIKINLRDKNLNKFKNREKHFQNCFCKLASRNLTFGTTKYIYITATKEYCLQAIKEIKNTTKTKNILTVITIKVSDKANS